jgi:hypothetical protein
MRAPDAAQPGARDQRAQKFDLICIPASLKSMVCVEDADVFVFGGKQHQPASRTLDDAKKRRGEFALIGARSGGRLAAPSEAKRMTPLLLLPAIW